MKKLLPFLLLFATVTFAGSPPTIKQYVEEYNVIDCEEALDYFQRAHAANPSDEYFEFMLKKWEDRCF